MDKFLFQVKKDFIIFIFWLILIPILSVIGIVKLIENELFQYFFIKYIYDLILTNYYLTSILAILLFIYINILATKKVPNWFKELYNKDTTIKNYFYFDEAVILLISVFLTNAIFVLDYVYFKFTNYTNEIIIIIYITGALYLANLVFIKQVINIFKCTVDIYIKEKINQLKCEENTIRFCGHSSNSFKKRQKIQKDIKLWEKRLENQKVYK